MTLGQRIQDLRRSQGLSQEALGDLLGVSRQAISKWESDITIPEVDKLIAISRQFEVSVGYLLGVEEICAPKEQETSHELTERELAAVETIVNRYLEQMQSARPQSHRRTKLMGWGAAALVVLLLASVKTVSKLNDRIDRLSDQTQNVQNQVIGVENTVSNQINSLTGRLEKLLAAQSHLLSEWDCVLTDYIPGEKAIFSLSARPKEYVPGMTAAFSVENDVGDQVSVPAQWNGSAFVSQMDVPLWDDPAFFIELDDGQSRKTQPMETAPVYMLKSDFGLHIPSMGTATSLCQLTKQGELILDMQVTFELEARTPGGFNRTLLHPAELTAVVWYGDTQLQARNLSLDRWLEDEGEGEWKFDVQGEFPVQGEDTLRVEVIVTDNYGITTHWDIENDWIEYE